MKKTTEIGNQAEEQACDFLKENGYEIKARNYRCRYGEIDIIAIKNQFLAIIEVKKRKSTTFGRASEYVTPLKCEKIIKTTLFYISENRLDLQPRFDVIEINGTVLNHIENAFEAM